MFHMPDDHQGDHPILNEKVHNCMVYPYPVEWEAIAKSFQPDSSESFREPLSLHSSIRSTLTFQIFR